MVNLNLDNILKSGECMMREDMYQELLACEYTGVELLKKHLDDFLLPGQVDSVYTKLSAQLIQERPADCTHDCHPIFHFKEVELHGERWCVMGHYYEKTPGFRKSFDSSIAFRVRKDYDTLYFRVDTERSYAGVKFLEEADFAPIKYDYHDFTAILMGIRNKISGKRLEIVDAFFERIRPASVATKFNCALRFTSRDLNDGETIEITVYLNGRVSHRICVDTDVATIQ